MRRNFIDRLLLPAIVGLIAVICVLILWQRLLTKQRADIQAETKAQASYVKNKVESELRERTLPLELLAEHWQVHRNSDSKSDSSLVMLHYPVYQAIAWISPAFNPLWVSSRQGSSASLGATPWTNARTHVALRAAAESGRIVVTHPFNLQNGDPGLLLCLPVYTGEKLDGFLVGVLGYHELFDSMLQDVMQNYSIAVYDQNKEVYPSAANIPRRDSTWAEGADIVFRQLTWRVQVWPRPKTLAYARSPLPRVTFIGGMLLAGLLAFAVYTAEAAHLQSRQVEASNKGLQREIASREQAEEALHQARKMEAVGQLASGVAHNFNNLLTVIRGQATLSLNHFGSDHPICQKLNEIVKTTDRASALTRQLLAFSRKQLLLMRVLDLNTLVTQVGELLRPALGKNIRLVMDLAPELGLVKTDAGQMEQVIMNLVFNARDAMPAGGDLTIMTANTYLDEAWRRRFPGVQPGPHVVLAVRDTGRGMDEATQARMFEPFFTTKDKSKGTGLGLSTVYATVNKSGGCITVSSKPGKGTTIQICLPRIEEPVQTVEPREVPTGVSEVHETILLVEDDDAVRHMTREFLTIKGYTVKEARSGAEAIEFLEKHPEPIELVLTDVTMPGMLGRELGERLTEVRTGIKILFMSAYGEDVIMNDHMLVPGTPFIEKPFSPEELAFKVREVLVASRSDQHAESCAWDGRS